MVGGRLQRSCVRLLVVAAAAAGLPSCTPATRAQIVVVVHTDMTIPGELDNIEIRVLGPDATGLVRRQVVELGPSSGRTLPTSFGVAPRDGDVDRLVRVEIDARLGERVLFGTWAASTFVRGEVRRLDMYLWRRCATEAVTCSSDESCSRDGCAFATVDPRTLPLFDPAGSLDPPDGGPSGRDTGECARASDCTDGVSCTREACDFGVCQHLADDTLCASIERCDADVGCVARSCSGAADCDDSLVCDGTEVCAAGLCAAGPPLRCDDGVACTLDSCDDTLGRCTTRALDDACDDGNDCNGVETCDAISGCRAGTTLVCDDGDDTCTDDGCRTGACSFTTRDADVDGHGDAACPAVGGVPADDCDDGRRRVYPGASEACNGRDDDCDGVCENGLSCCQGQRAPCVTTCGSDGSSACDGGCVLAACVPPAETCDGRDDDCDTTIDEGCGAPCTDDVDCDDRAFCTGVEVCSARGFCDLGVPPTCDDGLRCTVDSCDATSDACVHSADDRFCDDGDGCNGVETCDAVAGCRAGPSMGCDDMDACTDDECGGAGAGACVHTTADDDGDGFGRATCPPVGAVPATDCDDTRPEVRPGAMERCNGRDDDCDATIDDGFECVSGGGGAACTTSCGSTGSRACGADCTLGPCLPPAEACNGLDDDCDLAVDETVECTAASSGACTTMCGSIGTHTCAATCTWGACVPPAETCNGADDDCDGSIDDGPGFDCAPGATGFCTTTCGSVGSRRCDIACSWGACMTPPEDCNGTDDDCDARIDEGFTCAVGAVDTTCTTACGTSGTRTCSTSCGWSACSPPPETCNGTDDDCNTVCDDGFACCAGMSGTCTTSCGSTGARTCSAACAWGACAEPAETCNGADDDCDGSCDDGFTCCRGASVACIASCGSTGARTCAADCSALGACIPPAEVCTGGVDDDCDTRFDCADSDCTAHPACAAGCGGTCPGATAIVPPGGRYSVTLGPNAQMGSCGGSGSEAYLVVDITSPSDMFVTTHGAPLDTIVYVRRCDCTGAEVGCNDNADGRTTSALQLSGLTAGRYHIVIDTRTASTAMLDVHVYVTAAGVLGDRCGRPEFIAPGTAVISGSTCGYTGDYRPAVTTACTSAGGIAPAEDRVYYFLVSTAGTVGFDACAMAGPTNYDTTAYVRSVCTDTTSAAQLGCDDDGCAGGGVTCNAVTYRSLVSGPLSPGLHFLLADGYEGSTSVGCRCGTYEYAVTGL